MKIFGQMNLVLYNLEMEEIQKYKDHRQNTWTPQRTRTDKLPSWVIIICTLSKLYNVLE
jgi:hypothetical protein